MEFLGSLIVIAIFMFLISKITNKLLGVKERQISETPGKNIERWGRGIIFVILLCTTPFVNNHDSNEVRWYLGLYPVLFFGFQSILEWKYIKNSKQYLTTIIFLMFFLIIIFNVEYFFKI